MSSNMCYMTYLVVKSYYIIMDVVSCRKLKDICNVFWQSQFLMHIWRDPWLPRQWSLRPRSQHHKHRPCRLKWVKQLIDRDRMEWKGLFVMCLENTMQSASSPNVRVPQGPPYSLMGEARGGLLCVALRKARGLLGQKCQ